MLLIPKLSNGHDLDKTVHLVARSLPPKGAAQLILEQINQYIENNIYTKKE